MNWHQRTRRECEAAAAAGDPDAQAEVQLHQALDRICADMFGMQLSVAQLERLADELVTLKRKELGMIPE